MPLPLLKAKTPPMHKHDKAELEAWLLAFLMVPGPVYYAIRAVTALFG